jgi:hypothetical protein
MRIACAWWRTLRIGAQRMRFTHAPTQIPITATAIPVAAINIPAALSP